MRDFKSFFLKKVPQKDRFLKGDKPTQEMFARLFDSVGFIKEKTDTATTDEQGFVKMADAASAKSFSSPKDGFSYAVKPEFLPETKGKDLDQAIGDSSMPLTTLEVVKDDSNKDRNTYFIRIKKEFLQWMVTRLLPGGGSVGQILKKGSNSNYSVEWRDKDFIENITITGKGVDYGYYHSGVPNAKYLFSGQGILMLKDINTNSYILQGDPDPKPGTSYPSAGEYNRIEFQPLTSSGAPNILSVGYRLKLQYTGALPMNFFEYGVFSGNLDLGSFAKIIGNRRGITVYKNDTLTFVFGPNKKWILWEHNTPLWDVDPVTGSEWLIVGTTAIPANTAKIKMEIELPSPSLSRRLKIRRSTRLDTVEITGRFYTKDNTLVLNGSMDIFTLPVGWRPNKRVYGNVIKGNPGGISESVEHIKIETSGVVSMGNASGHISYADEPYDFSFRFPLT